MKKQPPGPEQAAQLQSLRERLILTINFFENAQDFENAARFRAHVERAAEEGNLRRMRRMASEIDKMTIVLSADQRDGLEALLSERLGIDKDVERGIARQQVAVALARGTIASEKERRRLEDYVEMLEATTGDSAEIEAVLRLLRTG